MHETIIYLFRKSVFLSRECLLLNSFLGKLFVFLKLRDFVQELVLIYLDRYFKYLLYFFSDVTVCEIPLNSSPSLTTVHHRDDCHNGSYNRPCSS